MGKVGIIAVIPKEYSAEHSPYDASLRQRGLSAAPGTGRYIYPYKELTGEYRTGLNPKAPHILRIKDEAERKRAISKIEDRAEIIRRHFGEDFDFSPRSKYYNHALKQNDQDELHTSAVKLKDGDNIFNLEDPRSLLTFCWLSAHPTIASSYESYLRGDYPADTKYYVKEEEVEAEIKFRKKQAVNGAISKLDAMSVEKRLKVARMLGLGVSDSTEQKIVYNLLDDLIKSGEVKSGDYKGTDSIEMFNQFADMNEDDLYAKDLIKQALTHNIVRRGRGGRIEEGGIEVAASLDDYVDFLLKEQKELVILEQKLKQKKIALS